MRIAEIYDSIDGEGIFAGKLATFVRVCGCNLRCVYCDTAYAQDADRLSRSMSVDDIVHSVEAMGYKHVTITGGEPLIHAEIFDLVETLSERGYTVNIETNGSIDISDFLMPNVVVTMDYKLDCSGERRKMNEKNLRLLRPADVLKFVTVASDSEIENIFDVLDTYRPKANVFLSPVYGRCKLERIVKALKEYSRRAKDDEMKLIVGEARIQIQLHKAIWDADRRGV